MTSSFSRGTASRSIRYFPELRFPDGKYVIDGELVILGDDGAEIFDALQNRIHPAESRITMLAEETPAIFRAFDLLAEGRRKLLSEPFASRRDQLESLIASAGDAGSVELTPLDPDPAGAAEGWLQSGKGRDRQAGRRALPPWRAQGLREGEATADGRRRGGRVAAGQGGGHRGLADPGSLRRRRPPGRGPHLGPEGEAEAGTRQRRSRPTSRASAARPTPAAGPPTGTWSGYRCVRSWSSR